MPAFHVVEDFQHIVAMFLEERSKDEICREFGVDREYLRVLVHRAKNRARVILVKQLGAVD